MLLAFTYKEGSKEEVSGLRGATWIGTSTEPQFWEISDPKHVYDFWWKKLAMNQCNKSCLNVMWQLHFRRVPRDAPIASLKSTCITLLFLFTHSHEQTLKYVFIVIIGYLLKLQLCAKAMPQGPRPWLTSHASVCLKLSSYRFSLTRRVFV